jgi:hypothetical protein
MIRKSTVVLLVAFLVMLSGYSSYAADKAIVIPLLKTQSSFKGTLYHTIPFAQFVPGNDTGIDYMHGWLFASLGYLQLQAGSLGTFNAPVNLPDNAIVTQVSLSASDNNNGGMVTVYFEKLAMSDTTVSFIPDQAGTSSASLTTDATGIISTPIDNEVIDNENYYYFIYALFNSSPSDQLKAVRIQYHLP